MALHQINKDLSRSQLRQFAGIWLPLLLAVLGWSAWRSAGLWHMGVVLWATAPVLMALGLWRPELVRPVYRAWMIVVFPIGWTVSHAVMAGVYFLVITPLGLVLRLLGHDPMQRAACPQESSYWVEHEPSTGRASYFRQY